ncbi:helix-turn-helix domain-containing protein [Enterococcus casseliflavus]|nr:helix-turn-helix domain-containing protein [Enterococcus casseliflavus]
MRICGILYFRNNLKKLTAQTFNASCLIKGFLLYFDERREYVFFSVEGFEETIANVIAKEFEQQIWKLSIENNQTGWLSLKQACEYVAVSRGTLEKWISEYGLSVSVIEGTKRIKKSDLDEFMLSKQC